MALCRDWQWQVRCVRRGRLRFQIMARAILVLVNCHTQLV
jgi:hypothetical protein